MNSAPKLSALLDAIQPDGTLFVHVSHDENNLRMMAVETLWSVARRMSRNFGECVYRAGRRARTLDEFDEMVDLSMYATRWIQSVCLQLYGDDVE